MSFFNASANQATPVITSTGTITGVQQQQIITNIIDGKYVLEVRGDANITGALVVDGIDLIDRIKKIEEVLGILTSDVGVEDRWGELKDIATKYNTLYMDILEKEKIMRVLNGVDEK